MNHKNTNMQKRDSYAGTLTVEAAMVLPLLLFAILSFVYLFRIMEFQLRFQSALNQTAEETASYGYLIDRLLGISKKKTAGLLEETEFFSSDGLISSDEAGGWLIGLVDSSTAPSAFKLLTERCLKLHESDQKRIQGGWEKVNFRGSSWKDSEKCVRICVEYQLCIPFVPQNIATLTVRQQAVSRLFMGDKDYVPKEIEKEEEEEKQEEEENGRIYYVAETGTVYHLSKSCTYLQLSIHSTSKDIIDSLRNVHGGKYYPCKRCAKKGEDNQIVFYTEDGTSYHYHENCSSLKRTIYEVTEEELGGKPPCSRCGKKQE